MGDVKRLLHSSEIAPAPEMYAGSRSIEAAESMHIHERNVRLEYSPVEFMLLIDDVREASADWDGGLSDKTIWLRVNRGLGPHPDITPTRFEVEESEYPTLNETTIHVHYRNLRLEFTHREWEEFANGITEAMKSWKTR